MKAFNELTRAELAKLGEVEIDAYVDIELANNNITKPIHVVIDYPNYLRTTTEMPEKDVTVYEVDGYTFPDIETATKFTAFVGTLPQVRLDYDYKVGHDDKYVQEPFFASPQVTMAKVYSEPKYRACSEKIKQIREARSKAKQENKVAVDEVIDYEAIDRVRYEVHGKVRAAIEFFARAKTVASDFGKYLSITGDEVKAYETLFTVFNVQDEEFKAEVREQVEEAKTAAV
jgi:hypothetical protein